MLSKLLTWLLSLFAKDKYAMYSPKEREIYCYFNGEKAVRADPMPLFKSIMDQYNDLSIDFKMAAMPSKDASKAWDNAVGRVRAIFGIKKLEDGGLTERETVDLYNHFWDFIEAVKKNSPSYQTPPADGLPTSASCTPVCPIIPNTSDSGLTEAVSKTDLPEPLPEACPSPTEKTQA